MARKKKGLPFVVQPRLQPIIEQVGSEESGIIEITRRGFLTVAEKTIVDQATSDLSDSGGLIDAVQTIASAENRPVSEIFEELQGEEGHTSPLLDKYALQIAAASTSAQSQQRKIEIIAATALIICRIDTDWTVEQSMELHPDLLNGLYDLYREEDSRSLEAFQREMPENEGKK